MPTWTVKQTAGDTFSWYIGDQNQDPDNPSIDIRLDEIPDHSYDAEITITCEWGSKKVSIDARLKPTFISEILGDCRIELGIEVDG